MEFAKGEALKDLKLGVKVMMDAGQPKADAVRDALKYAGTEQLMAVAIECGLMFKRDGICYVLSNVLFFRSSKVGVVASLSSRDLSITVDELKELVKPLLK